MVPLEVPVMTAVEAAHQLNIPASTLKRWLDGHHRQGQFYEPVLRETPNPDAPMTWGEIVEADYLREYRRTGVPMQRLRPFILYCREKFELRYPLAHYRPFTDGRRILLEAQEAAGLGDDLRVVYELKTGQLELDSRVQSFLYRVERDSDGDIAQRLWPDGRRSPVVHDPNIASGAATVDGVRTEIIREQYEVGEDTRDIAEVFQLPLEHVVAALEHERRLRPLQVA